MARYEVIIPWYGVRRGQVIETDRLHAAVLPNVRKLDDVGEAELVPATPSPTRRGRPPKQEAE